MVRIAAALLLCFTLAGQTRSVSDLKRFFQMNCVRCHGQDGSAVSPEGLRLKGLDFTSAQAMKGTNDSDLAATIRKGVFFGLTMPAFRDELSDEDALLMVRGVLRKAEKGKPIAPLRSEAKP